MKLRVSLLFVLLLALPLIAGCNKPATIIEPFADDVEKQLDPGEFGLEKLNPADYPDMRVAWSDRTGLEQAIDKSIAYLEKVRTFIPSGPNDPITREQIHATLLDIKKMLHDPSITPDRFQQEVLARYEVWTSKGYNRKGDVWFTGYFTPIYHGSLTRTAQFQYPVYKRPADLQSDSLTGAVYGQGPAGGPYTPYPTRSELEKSGKLKGTELAYFSTPLEAYIIQVQGSAKVILPDGKEFMIGFAGKNGRDYHGLGSELVKDGKIDKKRLSLPAVIEYFAQHPGEQEQYIARSDSFVFLKQYEPAEWPSGSLGFKVTPQRSLATDKKIFPRASLTFIDVAKPAPTGEMLPYKGFLLDQDSGGAIQAAGRADIYMGIGETAGKQAGYQYAQGRLFYIFLKPELVPPMTHPNLTPTKPSSPKPGTTPAKKPTTPTKPVAPDGGEMFPGAIKK